MGYLSIDINSHMLAVFILSFVCRVMMHIEEQRYFFSELNIEKKHLPDEFTGRISVCVRCSVGSSTAPRNTARDGGNESIVVDWLGVGVCIAVFQPHSAVEVLLRLVVLFPLVMAVTVPLAIFAVVVTSIHMTIPGTGPVIVMAAVFVVCFEERLVRAYVTRIRAMLQ